ncbi:MAG: VWA domain-containing protein [Gammaproteobacteria bacterium]|nr:VWA domain-containing protein [Gammaproteobacteria bacterium]
MKKIILTTLLTLSLSACNEPESKARAVYLLLDTSGTYTAEMDKAQKIMDYLLATLDSGDSIAIARIDSGSFSEKDIIARVTFDDRPSTANQQKRLFKAKIDEFVADTRKGSRHTDITGGMLQASEYLEETGAGEQYVLIFSDLEEDLQSGHIRDFPISLPDIHVVALNVTKLRSDNIDPRDYMKRLDLWETRVYEAGGTWGVINDLERMDRLIAQR